MEVDNAGLYPNAIYVNATGVTQNAGKVIEEPQNSSEEKIREREI
ncbi:MAG TPA: hypothetical protein PLO89_02510 [Spirochaetota bacterium]|nr:hypothetical protein [Spirochaetota bacterium]